MKSNYAPIVLFVYARPHHTRRVIEALLKNDLANHSDLYIYADGPKITATEQERKNIQLVREFIHTIVGFNSVTIIEQQSNKGLDPSEIDAITEIVEKYGKVIALEDDTIPHPYFLRFMNDALAFYENNKKVYAVGSYSPKLPFLQSIESDVYVSYRCESCGWATWQDRWTQCNWDIHTYNIVQHPTAYKIFRYNRGGGDLYDSLLDVVEGRTDAWDARWQHCLYLHNAVCVRPTHSLSYNIGFDGTGVHCGTIQSYETSVWMPDMYDKPQYNFSFSRCTYVSPSIVCKMRNFYRYDKTPWWIKLKRKIKRFLFAK